MTISKYAQLILAAALCSLNANAARAEAWINLYMADTGGSRLWQTDDPAEATYVYAAVDSPDGVRLIVNCRGDNSDTWISIGEIGGTQGPTFLSPTSEVLFSVDKKGWRSAANLQYVQSSYQMTIPNSLVREIAAGRTLVMSYGPDAYQRKVFSLSGARRALNAVDCNRLE